jgi:hypothetical protein
MCLRLEFSVLELIPLRDHSVCQYTCHKCAEARGYFNVYERQYYFNYSTAMEALRHAFCALYRQLIAVDLRLCYVKVTFLLGYTTKQKIYRRDRRGEAILHASLKE